MDKANLDFFLNQNVQIELSNFILSLLCAAFLSFIVHLFYVRFSTTLSNRIEFSKNFVVLGVATCIVIMIVKSSLALSLGLVGALSIVRFRAAIKEPEELVYLFLIIAVGLGCGANQLVITAVGIFFALFTILIYSKYLKRSNNTLIDIINKSTELKFISMSRTEHSTSINVELKTNNFNDLTQISGEVKKQYPSAKTIIAQNTELSL